MFAPKPRDYSQKVNKEAKRAAFRSAISTKLQDKDLIIVENLKLEQPKTKLMVEVIKNLKIEKTVLFVTKGKDELVMRAVSNIAKADVTTANLLNVYDIVASSKVVLTSDAAKYIEEAYKA